MKKLLFLTIAILLVLFTVDAMAQATAVHRPGDYLNQYKIDDVGGEHDNKIVYIADKIAEIVIQASGVDYTTSKESLRCWARGYYDDVDCPTEATDPVLVFLESIMIAGNVTHGAWLTDLQEKKVYLAYWNEYKLKKLVVDALAEMDTEGLNDLQKRRALKYIYFGHGIDLLTAQSIANARVINSIVATYDDLGLATIPLQDRRLLKLFGEVGWFEE